MPGKCSSNLISTTLPRTETTAPRFERVVVFVMYAFQNLDAQPDSTGVGRIAGLSDYPSPAVFFIELDGHCELALLAPLIPSAFRPDSISSCESPASPVRVCRCTA